MFCDFPTLSRICIFFLLTLSLLIFSLLIFLFSLPLPCSAFHLSILSEVWLLNFLRQLACAWFQVVAWLPSVWVHYLLRGVKFQHPWTKWIEPKLGSKVTRNARTSTNLKSVAAFALEFSGGTSKRLASVNQKTLQIRVWGVHESRASSSGSCWGIRGTFDHGTNQNGGSTHLIFPSNMRFFNHEN